MKIATTRFKRRVVVIVGTLLLGVALATGGWYYWFYHRSPPPAVDRELFQGVHYTRIIRRNPRPLVIHVVRIQLDQPGIRFLVTPGDPVKSMPLTGKLTTEFLRENKLQLAINANFFRPWWSKTLWDYYPHVGDPVKARGFTASNGTPFPVGPKDEHFPVLNISADNRATITENPPAKACNAVSASPVLVRHGIPIDPAEWEHVFTPGAKDPHPRTAAGITRDGKTLLLVLVDGRQPNYSEGVTLRELAFLMVEFGADIALNLDGGGSSTLVMEGASGQPETLNCPINNRVPERERPVANHLGIYATKGPAPIGG